MIDKSNVTLPRDIDTWDRLCADIRRLTKENAEIKAENARLRNSIVTVGMILQSYGDDEHEK